MEINIPVSLTEERLIEVLRKREIKAKPRKIKYWIDPEIYDYSLGDKSLQITIPIVYQVNDKNYCCAPNVTVFIKWNKEIKKITIGKTRKGKTIAEFSTAEEPLTRRLIGRILRKQNVPKIAELDNTKYFRDLKEVDALIEKLYPEIETQRENSFFVFRPRGYPQIKLTTKFLIREKQRERVIAELESINKVLTEFSKEIGDLFEGTDQYFEMWPYFKKEVEVSQDVEWYLDLNKDYKTKCPFSISWSSEVDKWKELFKAFKRSLPYIKQAYAIIKKAQKKEVYENKYFITFSREEPTVAEVWLIAKRNSSRFDFLVKEDVEKFEKVIREA